MKITVKILKRNRTIETKNVDPTKNCFEFQGGIYAIYPEAVNITTRNGVINSHPEVYYVEGDPIPLFKHEKKDTQQGFLDEVVLKNAIEALSGKPGMMFSLVLDYLKNPKKLLLLGFVVIIAVSFLSGMV